MHAKQLRIHYCSVFHQRHLDKRPPTKTCFVLRVDVSLLLLYPSHSITEQFARVLLAAGPRSTTPATTHIQPNNRQPSVLEYQRSVHQWRLAGRTRGANFPSRACNHALLVQRSRYARSNYFFVPAVACALFSLPRSNSPPRIAGRNDKLASRMVSVSSFVVRSTIRWDMMRV